jgi:nicotinate-nucleotide pyrophosphorylase (carboxylating)
MAPRKSGVICGLSVAEAAFKIVDPSITFEALAEDGEEFPVPRTPVARITGNARAILTAERTALNFISHMSGIATQTAKFVDLVKHTNAKICCTRKTTPNLRAFEKYAIRCGGGLNHRFGLDDAFLIKDNHIAVCGGIKQALQACKAHAGHLVKIEIEVDGLDQLREVIEEGADVVLFDNMTPEQMAEGVKMIGGKMRTEASGGINIESVKAVAESGVDMISSGALTHSSAILDIGLDIELG